MSEHTELEKTAAHLQLVADNTRKLDLILGDILDKGLVVADEKGELTREHPPAAYLKLVHERAKLYNMGKPMPGKHTSHQVTDESLRKALEHAGDMPDMPPVSTEDPDTP